MAARQREKAAAHLAETNHISRLYAGFGPNLGFQQFYPESHLHYCKCPCSVVDFMDFMQVFVDACGIPVHGGHKVQKVTEYPRL